MTVEKRRAPVEVARDIINRRFPKARLAFVAGSFNRGEDTPSSDIDLVVVFEKVDRAYREAFVFEGWPVEAFIHDPETMHYFFMELDLKDGIPALPQMVLEGVSIPDANDQLAQTLKGLAKSVMEQGPPPLTPEDSRNRRYFIADLLDDLRTPRDRFEAAVVAGALHEALGDFYFRTRGQWSGARKQLVRRLRRVDPKLAERWERAFSCAFQGETGELVALVEDLLSPYNGPLFDGYRRDAPPQWRRPLPPH